MPVCTIIFLPKAFVLHLRFKIITLATTCISTVCCAIIVNLKNSLLSISLPTWGEWTVWLCCEFVALPLVCLTLQPHGLQCTRLPCPSVSPGVCSNSCPLSQWCYPTVSSSVTPFSSCPQSFPASRSVPVSRLLPSGGHGIGASASASVFSVNTQGWFPLGLTGLISSHSKGSSRVFSCTIIRKHWFFGTQLSLWFNSHIQTWLLEKP